jgi:hypothetical protein
MEVDMSHQEHVGTYRAALEAAMGELDNLFEEARRLRNRMEQIDSAITALKPLLASAMEGQPASQPMSTGYAQDISIDAVPMKQQIDAALGLVFA